MARQDALGPSSLHQSGQLVRAAAATGLHACWYPFPMLIPLLFFSNPEHTNLVGLALARDSLDGLSLHLI
jgi:hypothetical protein